MIFDEIVQSAVQNVHGGLAAVIMGRDGISLSQFMAEHAEVDIETLGIEYANLFAEIGKAAATLGSGSVQEVMLLTDQYQIVIRSINPEYFIALILTPDGNLGKGRFLLRVCIPRILAEL
jgi:predicted regulator of Ras-like GTPase activity (Roadblock/LC7/MglB family)